MRIARNQVDAALLEQRERTRARTPAAAPVDRRRRHLHEDAELDELRDQLRPALHVAVPLRVGEYGREAAFQQRRERMRDVERPTEVGSLDKQVARVPAEPEPRELFA